MTEGKQVFPVITYQKQHSDSHNSAHVLQMDIYSYSFGFILGLAIYYQVMLTQTMLTPKCLY